MPNVSSTQANAPPSTQPAPGPRVISGACGTPALPADQGDAPFLALLAALAPPALPDVARSSRDISQAAAPADAHATEPPALGVLPDRQRQRGSAAHAGQVQGLPVLIMPLPIIIGIIPPAVASTATGHTASAPVTSAPVAGPPLTPATAKAQGAAPNLSSAVATAAPATRAAPPPASVPTPTPLPAAPPPTAPIAPPVAAIAAGPPKPTTSAGADASAPAPVIPAAIAAALGSPPATTPASQDPSHLADHGAQPSVIATSPSQPGASFQSGQADGGTARHNGQASVTFAAPGATSGPSGASVAVSAPAATSSAATTHPAVASATTQIVAQATLVQNGQTAEMRLRLRPPDLGDLSVTLRRDMTGALTVRLVPATGEAAAVLGASLHHLHAALDQHSANGRASVSVDQRDVADQRQSAGQHPGSERPGADGGSATPGGAAPAARSGGTRAARAPATASGIDYDA